MLTRLFLIWKMPVFKYQWSSETEDTGIVVFVVVIVSCASECVLGMSGDILCIHLFFQSLMKYLQDESLDKRKIPFEASGWQTENVQVCHFETYI
jgi:hypothetical protein